MKKLFFEQSVYSFFRINTFKNQHLLTNPKSITLFMKKNVIKILIIIT